MLLPAQHVKGYLRGQKNDYNDAKAIAEACQHGAIRPVAMKSLEQQDEQTFLRMRQHVSSDRTRLINHVRGLLAEYGVVLSRGKHVLRKELPFILEDAENGLSDALRCLVSDLMQQWHDQVERIDRYDLQLQQISKENEDCQRLMSIPGIGPVNATLLLSHAGSARQFKTARHFAAYLGLVPRQHASGGKEKLLGITKRGNKQVRKQLVHGARSAYRALLAKDDESRLKAWLIRCEGKHPNKVIVALANKLARIIWAVLTKETSYVA